MVDFYGKLVGKYTSPMDHMGTYLVKMAGSLLHFIHGENERIPEYNCYG